MTRRASEICNNAVHLHVYYLKYYGVAWLRPCFIQVMVNEPVYVGCYILDWCIFKILEHLFDALGIG